MKEKLSGTVDTVIYQSPDGSYTVCGIDTDDGDQVTVVGALPLISEGDRICAYGDWSEHPTYGRQFRCEYYEQELPTSEDDMLRYLAAGNVKGIGPKTAGKIVDKFGSETFDVIENHPEWLADISGISVARAAAIGQNFREVAGARAVIMYCRDICSPAQSMKIYKKWGASAVDRIQSDPYCLCDGISGIGFTKADELAKNIGIPANSPARIIAGLVYILTDVSRRDGSTCLTEELLSLYASDLLCVEEAEIKDGLNEALSSRKLYAENYAGVRHFYLPRYHRAENGIAKRLVTLSRSCPSLSPGDIGTLIEKVEYTSGLSLADMQRQAIGAAMTNGVMILTGGPGTGKTTVTKALLNIFESLGSEVALAAPTGRAAKRMSEATSHEATTVHRLLETNFSSENGEEPVFLRDESNLLDEDVFIVDEISMMDTLLFDSLLRAIKPGARLILIGDSDQLPSVGAGNVLSDLIASGLFRTVRLTEIFRQSNESLIVSNAHAVNRGDLPVSGKKDGDFFILKRDTDAQIAETVRDLCTRRLPAAYGVDIASELQIITPSKKGAAGTEELCRTLQEAFNPPSPSRREHHRGTTVFREGDKVMQIKNNYMIEWEKDGDEGHGIFNGDIGVISSISPEDGTMSIDFDGRFAEYDLSDLDELELSYAITVHKSQGSEYPVVVIPVYSCSRMLLNRCLLYTAITRASKLAIIVAKENELAYAVANTAHADRTTGLHALLARQGGDV